jgi:hypothetical protein
MNIIELKLLCIFQCPSSRTIWKIKLWLTGFILVFTSHLAMATEGTYFYGAVDYGEGRVSSYCAGIPAGVTCTDKNSASRLSVGYQVISAIGKEGIGIEASYVNDGKGSFSGQGVAANMSNSEWQLDVTGTMPLDETFILISKAGLALWNLKTTSTPAAAGLSPTGMDFLWGVGAEMDLSKTIALRCMFDSHLIGDSVTGRGTLATLTLGALFRF